MLRKHFKLFISIYTAPNISNSATKIFDAVVCDMLGSYDSSFLVLAEAVTPIHAGVGGKGAGIVDLPVQRDFAGYPCIWGSSFKGALRSVLELRYEGRKEEDAIIKAIFGPSPERAHEFGGCVVFGDLKLLAVPGPCGAGVCYFTSPLLLNYLSEFASLTKIDQDLAKLATEVVDAVANLSDFVVSSNECLTNQKLVIGAGTVIDVREPPISKLKDLFMLLLKRLGLSDVLANRFSNRVIVVPEPMARELIGRKLLLSVTRVALDYKTKTVRPGALWSEEYVPELTLFSGVMFASKPRSTQEVKCLDSGVAVATKLVKLLGGETSNGVGRFHVVLGGHETIGKGIVKVALLGKFSQNLQEGCKD